MMNHPGLTRRLAGGAAVVLAASALSLSATAPAQAARPAAVVSGNARFEVLSPTVIRTEYAPDGHFLDAGTFTAIGRSAFRPPAWTSRTRHGWLTIDTGRVTLRYRVG